MPDRPDERVSAMKTFRNILHRRRTAFLLWWRYQPERHYMGRGPAR